MIKNITIEDLRIEEFTNATPDVIMKITHIPSGKVVTGKGTSRLRLKEELLKKLND